MQNLYDLIIIGGGPAGCAAGIYAGRAKRNALILDQTGKGGQIGITSQVVNYPGIQSISGDGLMHEMHEQVRSFGVDYRIEQVTDISFGDTVKQVTTESDTYRALAVIIASGAVPRQAGFVGEEEFRGRGVGYCVTCDGEFFTGADIFVVGGGLAAAEESIFLTRYARKVYMVVRGTALTCPASIAQEVLAHKDIEILFQTRLLKASGAHTLESARFINDATGETWEHRAQDVPFGIFVFVGYQPVSDLYKGHIALNDEGYITTDEDLQTSVEGIYAAGDVRPKRLRQLVTAVADGALAATNAERYIDQVKKETGIEAAPPKETVPKSQAAGAITTPVAAKGEVSGTGIGDSFLSEELLAQLLPVLERFESTVTVVGVLDESKLAYEVGGFLQEFGEAAGDNVEVRLLMKGEEAELESEVHADRFPLIALLDKEGKYRGIKFHGVPGGHEFTSFVIALYNIAGPGQALDVAAAAKVDRIEKPTNIKVGVSLSCTMCPDTVMAAQLLAAKSPNIEAEMIDVSQFADFKDAHHIMSVPAIIINDDEILFGKKSPMELLDALMREDERI